MAAGAVVVFRAVDHGSHTSPHPPPAAATTTVAVSVLSAELRGRLLFFDEQGGTKIVSADGKVVKAFPEFAAVSPTARPIVTPGHLAVFVHEGQVYRVGAGPPWPVQHVGAADRLFPADSGDVGLEVGAGAGATEPSFVKYMAADGTIPRPGTTNVELPTGSTAVARLADGLVVRFADGRLRLLGSGPSVSLGPISNLIGVSFVTIAWTASSGCQPNGPGCPLHLSETARGADQVITPPAGFPGFVGGGGFSPDGAWLAAFVFVEGSVTPEIRLVIVDTRTGRAQLVGPVLRAGEPVGSATWSPDGTWLFFSGLSGPIYALKIARTGPVGSPLPTPLAASYAFAAL